MGNALTITLCPIGTACKWPTFISIPATLDQLEAIWAPMLAKLSAIYAVMPPCRTPNGCKLESHLNLWWWAANNCRLEAKRMSNRGNPTPASNFLKPQKHPLNSYCIDISNITIKTYSRAWKQMELRNTAEHIDQQNRLTQTFFLF